MIRSLEETIMTLETLGELIKDELAAQKEDDSDVHMIAVNDGDYWAIENAVNTLRGLRILNGIYKDEEGS